MKMNTLLTALFALPALACGGGGGTVYSLDLLQSFDVFFQQLADPIDQEAVVAFDSLLAEARSSTGTARCWLRIGSSWTS